MAADASQSAEATSDEPATLLGTTHAGATESREAEPELARGHAIGRFLAVAPIGRGASGVVWSAYDGDLDRRVAIKLLAPRDRSDVDERRWQLGEAQALAKIRHPNVVAVYDVGTHGSRPYLAMEFVEGTTLGRWCRVAGRTHDEILDAYTAAARGLAAVHDAGLVHRDFKPDNVLVDGEGRVRVADLGLAAPIDGSGRGAATRIAGTPAYMSPEHHAGRVDALSDQFSFCVALCEGLTGHRPLRGSSPAAIAAATIDGALAEEVLAQLPSRVRGLLVRGLARSPGDRHASMTALVAALERARRPRWPWAVGGLGLAAAIGVGARVAGTAPPNDACATGAARIASAWSDDAHARVRVVPGEYTAAHADVVAQNVRRDLDAHAARWAEVHDRVCAADLASGPAPDPTELARSACLDDRLASFAGTVDLVTSRELEVDAAERLVAALADPRACERADVATWEPVPAAPELAAAVAEVRAQTRALQLRLAAGELATAEAEVVATVASARAAGFPHALASVLLVAAEFEEELGHPELARQHLEEAVELALASGLDWLAARAAVQRIEHGGRNPASDAGSNEWEIVARALVERSGVEPRLAAQLHGVLATRAYNRIDYTGALDHYRGALAEIQRDPTQNPRLLALGHFNLALLLAQVGRSDEASEHARLGELAFAEQGSSHARDVIRINHLLALVEATRGRMDDAIMRHEAAASLALSVFGPRSRLLSTISYNLAIAQASRGRDAEARASLAWSRSAWPGVSDSYTESEFEFAEALLDYLAGDPKRALEHLDAAAQHSAGAVDSQARAGAQLNQIRAAAMLSLGDHRGALEILEAAYRRVGSSVFVSVDELADAAIAADLARDRATYALWLARSETVAAGDPTSAAMRTLVRAMANEHPDAATFAAVRDARAAFVAIYFERHPRVRHIDAWLAAHSGAVAAP